MYLSRFRMLSFLRAANFLPVVAPPVEALMMTPVEHRSGDPQHAPEYALVPAANGLSQIQLNTRGRSPTNKKTNVVLAIRVGWWTQKAKRLRPFDTPW
jgi:hypothetical protein